MKDISAFVILTLPCHPPPHLDQLLICALVTVGFIVDVAESQVLPMPGDRCDDAASAELYIKTTFMSCVPTLMA
jgi:hypothetical protein